MTEFEQKVLLLIERAAVALERLAEAAQNEGVRIVLPLELEPLVRVVLPVEPPTKMEIVG